MWRGEKIPTRNPGTRGDTLVYVQPQDTPAQIRVPVGVTSYVGSFLICCLKACFFHLATLGSLQNSPVSTVLTSNLSCPDTLLLVLGQGSGGVHLWGFSQTRVLCHSCPGEAKWAGGMGRAPILISYCLGNSRLSCQTRRRSKNTNCNSIVLGGYYINCIIICWDAHEF